MATAAIKSLGRDLFHSRRDASSDSSNAHPISPDGQPQAVSSMIFDPSATAPPMGQPAKDSDSNHPQEQHLLGGDVPTSDPDLQLSDFNKVKTLGTGTFARVWLVRPSHPLSPPPAHPQLSYADKEVYALKVLKKSDIIRLKQLTHIQSERQVLASISSSHSDQGHPFITRLVSTFRDHTSLYMLLEYSPGGELFSHLRRTHHFSFATARFYTAEIVLILAFLHNSLGVVYRDLKPENLLLDADGHVKLVDFGFAKRIDSQETYTLCGTPEYLAPEIIQSKGHNTAVDWWALGILLYEFLLGQPPFWDQAPMKIYEKWAPVS